MICRTQTMLNHVKKLLSKKNNLLNGLILQTLSLKDVKQA